MRTHFIAIGGSAMHNLALALHNKGYQVTGSDDAIFEPSKSRLDKKGILPAALGWFPEKITNDLDFIILGMHAREDNPELAKAKSWSWMTSEASQKQAVARIPDQFLAQTLLKLF